MKCLADFGKVGGWEEVGSGRRVGKFESSSEPEGSSGALFICFEARNK